VTGNGTTQKTIYCAFSQKRDVGRSCLLKYNFDMANWTPIRVITLFLALWGAIAPAMFAVPAATMTVQMSASIDCTSGDCDCCPNSGMGQNPCPTICVGAMSFAVIPNDSDVLSAHSLDENWLDGHPALDGHSIPPEPPPPKSTSQR
jgi:hypothetical protein